MLPRVRPHVHDPVRMAHDVQLVLHHEDRVALRLQPVERAEQALGVLRVQAGGRLVQHVHHAEQVAVHLGAEPEALELAGGERGRAALERDVAEAEVEQHGEPGLEVPARSGTRPSPSPDAPPPASSTPSPCPPPTAGRSPPAA